MPDKPVNWISTTALAEQLGVRPKFLRENRTKLFQPAIHYRLKNPTAYRPTYVWHPTKCQTVFGKATKEAAAIEAGQSAVATGRGIQIPFLPEVPPYEID